MVDLIPLVIIDAEHSAVNIADMIGGSCLAMESGIAQGNEGTDRCERAFRRLRNRVVEPMEPATSCCVVAQHEPVVDLSDRGSVHEMCVLVAPEENVAHEPEGPGTKDLVA
jgi:hypothetical protein